MTLQPLNKYDKEALLASDMGIKQNRQPVEFFCKTLTASDTSTHGGFSVSRRAAEKIFPPLSAVRDLKVQLKPPSMQARRLLLDSAIQEKFTRLKNLVEENDKKVKELHENIAAVSFTAQSKMGKMLMAKCRMLQEENKEIGAQAEEGKMHELTMKLALQESQNTEL